jgi:hypothetical protein
MKSSKYKCVPFIYRIMFFAHLRHLQVHNSYSSKHMFSKQYVFKNKICEPEDDLNWSKHVGLWINGTRLCLDGFYLDSVLLLFVLLLLFLWTSDIYYCGQNDCQIFLSRTSKIQSSSSLHSFVRSVLTLSSPLHPRFISHGRLSRRRLVCQRQRTHGKQWGLSHGRLSAWFPVDRITVAFPLLSLEEGETDGRLQNHATVCEFSDGRQSAWRLEAYTCELSQRICKLSRI